MQRYTRTERCIPSYTYFWLRFALVAAGALGLSLTAAAAGKETPTVVVLTQVACQFVESENGTDHKYKTTQKADCDAINQQTSAHRLGMSSPMVLKPGKYVFRVTNKNVPYALGFYLREKGYNYRNPVHQATKIAVSGGGLAEGVTRDYAVTLKPGEYRYSCPLNTTPDYTLVVKE